MVFTQTQIKHNPDDTHVVRHLASRKDLRTACDEYLGQRVSSYWFRCRRYKAVADKLFQLGLKDSDTIYDLGAGRCDFDYYLRVTKKWRGRYVPVDGSLDGTNLETWNPPETDWFVSIEVIEHLTNPLEFLYNLICSARKGVVVTTPNPATTDVLGMDPTHVAPIPMFELRDAGFKAETRSFFGKPKDSILAWRKR